MTAPLSNRPKITQEDIRNGYVTRYFVRHVSLGTITEVDKNQYEIFKNHYLYQTLSFDWGISGNAYDTIAVDGKTIYGTQHKNKTAIEFYSLKMPKLYRALRNPLEYFFGIYNTVPDIPTVLR